MLPKFLMIMALNLLSHYIFRGTYESWHLKGIKEAIDRYFKHTLKSSMIHSQRKLKGRPYPNKKYFFQKIFKEPYKWRKYQQRAL